MNYKLMDQTPTHSHVQSEEGLMQTEEMSSMEPFQNCTDTSDITEISLPQQLFLKPEAKFNVTVALPQVRLPGKTISNWEVVERLKQMIHPDEFVYLRVSKSTLEFIRFDAEIENRAQLPNVLSRLEGKSIKLSGFPELLKIKAAESKPDFPTRHDWDKYFRDAKNMNEMKPGERPDTIHIENLPSRWFISKKDKRNGIETPNEFTLHKVFEIFGEIRYVDIPMLDPYRNQMKVSISGIKKFSHSTDATFDAYIQYKEYICFVKAMNALRGMKLVHRDGNKAFSASIKVDFDKTKHLSDMSIRRRKIEREKLMAKEREKEEEKRREEEAIRIAMEEESRKKLEEKELKGKRQKEREEKRKQKILKKLKKKEAEQINIKIAIEERKLMMAQRKLESIRLLDELFERVKQERQRQEETTPEKASEADERSEKIKKKKSDHYRKKHDKERKKKEKLVDKEKELRKKLVKKIKTAQEQQMEERREKLLKTIEGKNKLKTGLRSKDGDDDEGYDFYNQPDFDYDVVSEYSGHDSYRGAYGYHDWGLRGFRGYPLRRPYRAYRGGFGHYQPDWPIYAERLDDRKNYETEEEKRKLDKTAADGMEDITSDDSSSDSSSYSQLDSSSESGNKKSKDVKSGAHYSGEWPLFEGRTKGEFDAIGSISIHPWAGYTDYSNPRFFRGRSSRRSRGGYPPRRGWGRGFPAQPNPNVPMNSFYMQSINSQYYKYFNKLAKGDYKEHEYRSRSRSRSRSRTRSHSNERVVCRKVLSRSRSRSRRYSRSRSKSKSRSRSKSGSASRPGQHYKSRSKSKSQKSAKNPSQSRSRSRSRRKSDSRQKGSKSKRGSRSKTKSRSRSKEKKEKENKETKPKPETVDPAKLDLEQKTKAVDEKISSKEKSLNKEKSKNKSKGKKKEKNSDEKKFESSSKIKSEESDWSLSLSESDGWSRGSPERKARPLGDPNWVPDRRDRDGDRTYRTIMSKITGSFRSENYMGYDRMRDRYPHSKYRVPEEREPNLRSHISKPEETSEIYHSDNSAKDSKKSRHKRDKKRKRKYQDKEGSSKKRKSSRSENE